MAAEPTYRFNQYRLLPARRLLLEGDRPLKLGSRAFDILVVFVENHQRIVSKQELMELVWPRLVVEENNLQVHVLALRKLLGHPAIATVPGRGYHFTLPVQFDGGVPASTVAAEAAVPPSAQLSSRDRLPVLYGRGDDVRTVQALLAQHALVSVVGPGGVGKTRLAEAVACEEAAARTDAAWWVDLAPLSQMSLMPVAVAAALRIVAPQRDDLLQVVLAELGRREGLLVLDNAEHLLETVVEFIAEVRRHAPRVRLLVTSQTVLHAVGEFVFRVDPLDTPRGDTLADVAASAAAALFVARAQAADRRFALREDNAGAVSDICRRLDGMPLAIELAAARIPHLRIDGLRALLDERLRLLTVSARGTASRHQTLRAALEWSHDLLSADERVVFRRLGVFVDGFSLDATRNVVADESIDAWDVVEHLGSLVDRSLVQTEGDAIPRYRLLETTRYLALEQLAKSGEEEAIRDRHQEHFLEFAEEVREQFAGHENIKWMQRLSAERDNLFAALAWLQSEPAVERGLRLAAMMRVFSDALGVLPHGYEATLGVLARDSGRTVSAARAAALVSAALQARLMGRHADARVHAEDALVAARQVGQSREIMDALYALGHAALDSDDLDGAIERFEEQAAIALDNADRQRLANARHALALVMQQRGELDAAARYFAENRALWRELGYSFNETVALMALAEVYLQADRAAQARIALGDALTIARRITAPRHAVVKLMYLSARVAAGMGNAPMAVRMYAALPTLRSAAGLSTLELEASERPALERCRNALGHEGSLREERAGRALHWEQALDAVEAVLLAPF